MFNDASMSCLSIPRSCAQQCEAKSKQSRQAVACKHVLKCRCTYTCHRGAGRHVDEPADRDLQFEQVRSQAQSHICWSLGIFDIVVALRSNDYAPVAVPCPEASLKAQQKLQDRRSFWLKSTCSWRMLGKRSGCKSIAQPRYGGSMLLSASGSQPFVSSDGYQLEAKQSRVFRLLAVV